MNKSQEHRGVAALAICESLLISLTERKIISEKEFNNVLKDAVVALEVESLDAGTTSTYEEAIDDVERILRGKNGVRRSF